MVYSMKYRDVISWCFILNSVGVMNLESDKFEDEGKLQTYEH